MNNQAARVHTARAVFFIAQRIQRWKYIGVLWYSGNKKDESPMPCFRRCVAFVIVCILIATCGCSVGQPADTVRAHLSKGEKFSALSMITEQIQKAGQDPKAENLKAQWFDTMADVQDIPQQPLSEEDCLGLSALGYLLHFTDCFLDARMLTKDQLLNAMHMYYNENMWLPVYQRPFIKRPSFTDAYPPEGENTREYYYYLSIEDAREFTRQTMGADIPDPNAQGQFVHEAVFCRDGQYGIYAGDMQMSDLPVAAYRYLGDGLYYVAFDEDFLFTPGPEESTDKIIPDSMRLIVRRSSSAWGFTAVAKLKGRDESILPENFIEPEGVTRLAARAVPMDFTDCAREYFAQEDPLEYLEDKTRGNPGWLSAGDIKNLNALAGLSLPIDPYLRTDELSKEQILSLICLYYQNALYYDDETNTYVLRTDIPYAPDGYGKLDWQTCPYISAAKAQAFVRDALGVEIPDAEADFGDLNDVVCRNGAYYIPQGDYSDVELRLRAYEYLGDGIFYLSFDGDDSNVADAPQDKKGSMPDYCRLLVVWSDSPWGFTILAKLKEGDKTLLPEDFPLPLYAA